MKDDRSVAERAYRLSQDRRRNLSGSSAGRQEKTSDVVVD